MQPTEEEKQQVTETAKKETDELITAVEKVFSLYRDDKEKGCGKSSIRSVIEYRSRAFVAASLANALQLHVETIYSEEIHGV